MEQYRSGKLTADKCNPFVLVTNNQLSFRFFTTTEHCRNIMMHELDQICTKQNSYVKTHCALQNVMARVQPIVNFNVYNLSTICSPKTSEQAAFE